MALLRDSNRLHSVFFTRELVMNTNNSVNIGKKFKIVSEQNTPGSHDFPVINTLGSLDSMVCWSNEIFKYTCSDACSKYTKKLTTGSPESPMYSPLGVKTPRVFTTGGWDFQVYSSPTHHNSRNILKIWNCFQAKYIRYPRLPCD